MRANRLVSLILLLQSRGRMTAVELAHELEVSRRTILRDVEALSAAGVPIYSLSGFQGGIELDPNYRTTLTGLNEPEILTLFISSTSRLLDDIGLGEAAESARLKLLAAVPMDQQNAVSHIQQRIFIDSSSWWHQTASLKFWKELRTGVFEDRVIYIDYVRADNSQLERQVEPYSLVAKGSVWYLVARYDDNFHIYRVSRLESVVLEPDHFVRQPSFDLETYWQQQTREFVEVLRGYEFTLRIHASKLDFVHNLLGSSYKITEPADADNWLQIHLFVDSISYARMLVFELGTQAVIIEPLSLRESVMQFAQNLL
jgi:predicted DNA-binding transcriptional regulator YafY